MFVILLLVAFFGLRYINSYEKKPVAANDFSLYESEVIWRDVEYGTISVELNEEDVTLALAADPARRRLGLSEVETLPEEYGMLFVFPAEEPHGFWMKQMNFSLDIIWLDRDRKIIKVMSNVSPETFPTTFGQEVNSQFVIELNIGSVQRYGLELGQEVEFELPFE